MARLRVSTLLCLALLLGLLPAVPAGAQASQPAPIERLAGAGRFATAAAVSGQWASAQTVVVATGGAFPDALTAGGLAAKLGAPLLLTTAAALPAEIAAEIDRLGATSVVLVGGRGVISAELEQRLVAAGRQVRRIAGSNRYATGAAVAEEIGAGGGPALLAFGGNFPDALSAGAYSAVAPRPLALSARDALPEAAAQALTRMRPPTTIVVGGRSAIADAVLTRLTQLGTTPRRVSGSNRFATSVAVAGEVLAGLDPEPVPLIIASGANFPDALVAAPLAARLGGLLLLVPAGDLGTTPDVQAFLTANRGRFSKVVVVGGAGAVSQRVADQVAALVGRPAPGPTVPGAPTGAAAIAGNASATVTWTAPSSDGGSPITGYTVTATPGGRTATVGAAARSATVTGLTNGTTYTFTVRATNAVGQGPPSAPSNAVTPTDPGGGATAPGAPQSVVAAPGNASATVTWAPPASDGGSPVTGYVVTADPGGATVGVPAPATTTVVPGLTNGTAYTFTVRAVNAVGQGPASAPSAPVTPRTVPGAPTGVTATAGVASATVTWTPPASNGGAAITGYTVTANPGGATMTVTAPATTTTVTGLANGTSYTFTVRATNAAGQGPASAPSNAVTPQGAAQPPGAPTNVTAVAGNEAATVSWTAPASDGGSPITAYTVTAEPGGATQQTGGTATSTSVGGLTNGTSYTFTVRATNAAGQGPASAPSNAVTPSAAVVTPVPPGETLDFVESIEAIYTGPGALQEGVTEGAIEPRRATLVRGGVADTDGNPLAGVQVTVLDRPELGVATSLDSGEVALVINGGGSAVLEFVKEGYLPVQRTIVTGWRDTEFLDLVMLTERDVPTTVDPDSTEPFQVVRGSEVDDAAGERQATLLYPAGTDAEMVLDDGTVVPLDALTVRATEYTVGEAGVAAMPGTLPPTTGYTYAVEFSVDEAEAAGAEMVRFSKPLVNYTENFIGAPVGSPVPTGWYDRTEGRWVPSDNGLVIAVVGRTGGLAEVDVTGDGVADSAAALAERGITDAERQRLASLYTDGTELWRVEITHFTPWDHNWPYGPPPNARPPRLRWFNDEEPDPCFTSGSVISCESQVMGEVLGVTGTSHTLHYSSDRVPGRRSAFTLDVPVTGAEPPPEVKGIRVRVEIAGRRWERIWAGSPANLSYQLTWDGLDALGNAVHGQPLATVSVAYAFEPFYYASPTEWEQSFSRFAAAGAQVFDGRGYCPPPPPPLGGGGVIGRRGRFTVAGTPDPGSAPESVLCGILLESTVRRRVGAVDARENGLGGWTVGAHHRYDPASGVLHLGTGEVETTPWITATQDSVLSRRGEAGQLAHTRLGQSATGARTDYLTDAVVAPDGTVYANECFNQCRVYRIDPDGIIHGFAGTGEKGTYSGEGGPATAAVLGDNLGPMAVAPDGTVYLATSHRINGWAIWFVRAVSPDGTIRTVAGHPSSPATFADRTQRFHGALATDARLPEINGMALAADGGLLLVHRAVDLNDNPGALRRIDAGPDPRIWVIAGGGTVTGDADLAPGGTNAAQYRFNRSRGVAVAPDGTIYIADPAARRVWAIGTDGLLRRVAGTSTAGNQWDGTGRPALTSRVGDPMNVAVAPDGTLWVRSRLSDGDLVWRLTEEAFVDHVAGVAPNTVGAPSCSFGQQQWDGTAAARVCLRTHQSALSVFPDGTAMAGDGRWGIRRFVPPLPGFTGSSAVIPSSDGTEVYEFTSGGRHLRTRDAVSGAVRLEFGYGSGGHLSTVTDAYGNVTRIERDVLGAPTAIVAPGGQRTTLTLEDGWLTRVADPMGHADRFTYDAGGLLRTHIDPTDAASSYGYDAEGHLTSATDPVEGVQTITRIAGQEALEVVHRSAEGLETRYRTTTEAAGRRRTVTDPSGAVSSTLTRTDGTVEHEAADGSRTVVGYGEDPRWGAVVPVAVSMTTSTPGQPGADPPVPPRTLSVTVERLAQYTTGDINDPFAYSELIERVTYGGASSAQATYRYNPTTRTLTRTSAGNRVVTTIFDQRGRPVSIDVPGTVDPVLLAYDSRGRPSTITQGAAAASSQVTTFTYDERNRLVSEADAAGRATTYEHDDADRVTAVHLPGGGTARFGYDEAGRRTSVTMPSGDVHELGWTPEGDPARYQAPGVAALTRSWDADGALQTITQPSGRTVAYGYDEGGRLATETTAASTTTFAYDGVTDVVAGVTNGTGPGQQTLAMDRDGDVLEGLVFGGVAQGSFAYAYNARQELTGVTLSVDGQDPVSTTLTRDSDGLITNEAGLAVTRSGPDAAPTRIADSWLRVDLTYDTLAQPTGRSLAIGGTTRYGLTVTYDRGGRISGRTENVDGTTSTWAYGRDGAGRVTEVRRNGTVVEEYTYDANGNRTSRRVGGGAVQSATYDDADRLLTQGGVTFTHHADGHVTGRGADTFSASARGDLLSATVGGTTATYTYDGLRRRTARTQGGQTEAYLYGDPANPFRITHVRAADGAVTTLRYDDGGLLVALERGGERFAVATDQVGSPRLVIAPDGTVAKRIAYDAYGVPTIELGAAFDLPIGFAGGLLDPLTGLVRFGLRDYDPAAGRWTSRDPAGYQGGQLNLYAYVDGDPVGLRDASGLGVVVGSSLFAGIGFDAEIAISSKGMSACIGVGIGTPGGSIGVKTGDPKSRSGLYTAGEVGAKVGDYGVGAGFEIDPCGMVNIEPPKAKFPGGWSIDTAGNIERSFEPPNTAPPPPKIKAQFEGKLVGRYCASTLG